MALKPLSGGTDGHFRVNDFWTAVGETWSPNWAAGEADVFYYDRLDRMYSRSVETANSCVNFDPTVFDSSAPLTDTILGSCNKNIFAVGEWDKTNNIQKLYGAINSGNNTLLELQSSGSAFDLSEVTGTDPFPATLAMLASQGGVGLIGSRTDGSLSNMIIFESAGYALQTNSTVRHTDNVQYSNVLAQIDLTTSRCDPNEGNGTGRIVAEIPINNTASPNQFEGPLLFGNEFVYTRVQFIPDEDSLLASPKGVLFFSHNGDQGNLTSGSDVTLYVKLVEWNPDDIPASAGSPNREQGRKIFESRFFSKINTEPESGGIGSSSGGFNRAPIYHPPTNTVRTYSHDGAGSDEVQVAFSLAAQLDDWSNPTALSTPVETGRTTTFEINASGDIGEPVAGESFTATLERVSSFEEALDTTGLPATSTVANPPIDSDLLEVFDNDDNLLTEGAGPGGDYTVVRSTGVITWQNGPNGNHPKAESGYKATYRHRQTPVSPPFGKLLTQTSRTDELGISQFRVQYDDNSDLVRMNDRIEVLET